MKILVALKRVADPDNAPTRYNLAQRLLFGHTAYGDLTPLFAAYFDTHTGHKREPASYAAIAAALEPLDATLGAPSDYPPTP